VNIYSFFAPCNLAGFFSLQTKKVQQESANKIFFGSTFRRKHFFQMMHDAQKKNVDENMQVKMKVKCCFCL
jgi:hypothetical protein